MEILSPELTGDADVRLSVDLTKSAETDVLLVLRNAAIVGPLVEILS